MVLHYDLRKDRECCFGDVVDGEINLSSVGEIVAQELLRTERKRAGVHLDVWGIMPNHMHIIMTVDASMKHKRKPVDFSKPIIPYKEPEPQSVMKAGSLGAVVNQFKGACTNRIRETYLPEFKWQARFHDHVIRNEKSLNKIREYIINNPMQWEMDEYNPDML